MAQNDVVRVGQPMPKISAVTPGGNFTVSITWAGGETQEIDLRPFIFGYRAFRPLRTSEPLWRGVAVEEHGSGITWSPEMDMAAYTLQHLAEAQRVMTTEDFRAWMTRHHLTLDTAAIVLGLSRRTVAGISSGDRAMDRVTTLACRGYDAALEAAE